MKDENESTDIPPALNREQWDHLEFVAGPQRDIEAPQLYSFIPQEFTRDGESCGQVPGVMRLALGGGARFENVPHDGLIPLIALANHALPDAHPNKLTRKDVMALHAECSPRSFDAQRAIAKLNAFLPPV